MDNFSKTKFYRAYSRPILNGIHKNLFIDGTRQPTHMSLDIHHIINDWFMRKFGIKARSSTIFVGTQIKSVEKYKSNNDAVIKKISFPEDSKYIFSLKIDDLYEDVNFLKYRDGYADERNIPAYLDQSNYQITDSPELIPSNFLGEIMVYCSSFLLEDL